MQGNKVVLIQVWFGQIPDYFWHHYETTKNIKGFDFLFFTNQNIELDSKNYKVIQTSVSEIEILLQNRLGTELKIKSNKKTCDLKASYGDIFSDYIQDYEYFGVYDIDTLFGDVFNYTSDLIGKYDIISIADEKFHNRISGPFLLFRNDEKLKIEYRSQEFITCFDNTEVECFEEKYIDQKLKDKYKIKFLYSINCETENGGKNTYECYWSGGKVYAGGQEKLLYHFYQKKHTKLDRIGNIITAKYNKVLLEDFYWVVSFTENYEALFHNLLKSIKKYSNRKCIIYSINYDYVLPISDLSSEQFIIRRINIAEGDKDKRGRDNNIISSKPLINYDVIQHFPNKKFVTIDSDIYFTVNSDDISKYFDVLEYYPLINSHIHEVIYLSGIYPDQEWTSPLQLLLDEMGVVDFVVPRRKTNVVLFDKRSEWFFVEQMEIYQKYKNKKPGILALHDEDTANAILSKYNLNKCLPLIDIEEVNKIDMEVFFKYSYHMTPISDYVILPKTKNEVLFFHGIKSQQHYDSIISEYGDSVMDCEEICMKYDERTLIFQKNSFLSTKKINTIVDFEIYDESDKLITKMENQMIFNYHFFYITNVDLNSGFYTIKIVDSSDKTCLFRDVLKVP